MIDTFTPYHNPTGGESASADSSPLDLIWFAMRVTITCSDRVVSQDATATRPCIVLLASSFFSSSINQLNLEFKLPLTRVFFESNSVSSCFKTSAGAWLAARNPDDDDVNINSIDAARLNRSGAPQTPAAGRRPTVLNATNPPLASSDSGRIVISHLNIYLIEAHPDRTMHNVSIQHYSLPPS
jgi:hypothetical protein